MIINFDNFVEIDTIIFMRNLVSEHKYMQKGRERKNNKRNQIFRILLVIMTSVIVICFLGYDLNKFTKGRVIGTNNTIIFPSLPISSWLWNSPINYYTQSATLLIQTAKQNGVSTIYLSIDEYLTISEISDPVLKTTRLNQFNDSLKNFIMIANANNIRVQGLTGNPNWINTSYSYIPTLFINYVAGFNKAYSGIATLDGIQFDIEFYSRYTTKKNLDTAAIQYLNLVGSILTLAKNSSINPYVKVGFAIPFSFDNTIYNVTYNGKRQVLAYHLLDLLNTYPYSYIAIMDYRNYTSGIDGSISLVQNELNYAQANTQNVSIYIGQETSNVQPAKTTFYGLGKSTLFSAINQIYTYYKQNPTLKGFSINDLPNYIAL